MTDLDELQRWMAALLRRRRALPRDPEVVAQAAQHVTGNDRLLPVDQLEIYREQFWLRHTAALVEDFPGLGGIIGQESWQRLVEEYLEAHPPASWTLRDLGARLPTFVELTTWLEPHELCVDMARLEWAYVELFDAPEPPPLDPDELAAIPADAWPAVRLRLAPALALLRARYPVQDLRHALRTVEGPVGIPPPTPQTLVLYRGPDLDPCYQTVNAGAFELLAALRDDLPLGEACERALMRAPGDAAALQAGIRTWFEDWARRRWIVGLIAP